MVGLGPGGADLLLPAARSAILGAAAERRFVRSLRHPAVDDLVCEGIEFRSCDDLYEAASEAAECGTRARPSGS